MLSGVLIVVPAAVAFLTGMNIGVIVLKAPELELPGGERPLAGALDPSEAREVAPWVSLCSLAVLILELPSFWISVGMGIGLGRELSRAGGYTLENMGLHVGLRLTAYWMIIVPALFLSAVAETAAIRGHVSAKPVSTAEPPAEDASPNQSGSPASPEPSSEETSEEPGDEQSNDDHAEGDGAQ